MSESTGNLDEMEQNNYSMSSTTNMDPKNNEELIIYVSRFVYISTEKIIFVIASPGPVAVAERPRPIPVNVRADNLANRRHGQPVSRASKQAPNWKIIFLLRPQDRRLGEEYLGSHDPGRRRGTPAHGRQVSIHRRLSLFHTHVSQFDCSWCSEPNIGINSNYF